MEARKADPTRTVTTGVRLTFTATRARDLRDGAATHPLPAGEPAERPDEIRGKEIGVLDEGDEVVLLEKRGTYWRVLCPDGREGWLHKMTLGDVVIDPRRAATAGRPATAGRGGGFEDILRAYTENRQQFGDA